MAKFKEVIDLEEENQSSDQPSHSRNKRNGGAIFFGVVRGKLAEGLDISNSYCRCVMMVGLPFPSFMDTKSKLKKEYLRESNSKMSENEHYMIQMKRGLNQSIGRVIRHSKDFGVILLLDHRFPEHLNSLSKWLRPFYDTRKTSYRQVKQEVQDFFLVNSGTQHSSKPLTEEVGVPKKAKTPADRGPVVRTPASSTITLSSSSSHHNGNNGFLDEYKKIGQQDDGVKISKILLKPGVKPRKTNEKVFPIFQNQESKKKVKGQTEDAQKSLEKKRQILEGNEDEDLSKSDVDLLKDFLSTNGKELKEIFDSHRGTFSMKGVYESLQEYKISGDFSDFSVLLSKIFKGIDSIRKSILISGLSLMLQKKDRLCLFYGLELDLNFIPLAVFDISSTSSATSSTAPSCSL